MKTSSHKGRHQKQVKELPQLRFRGMVIALTLCVAVVCIISVVSGLKKYAPVKDMSISPSPEYPAFNTNPPAEDPQMAREDSLPDDVTTNTVSEVTKVTVGTNNTLVLSFETFKLGFK